MNRVYYHIWAPHDDACVRLLVDEQLKRLDHASLITQNSTLHIGITGQAKAQIKSYLSGYNVTLMPDDDLAECHTLQMLYDDCVSLTDNVNVLYLHTKGLSHFYNNSRYMRNVNSWRHFLEFHVIDNWGECVRTLNQWHTVGPNFSRHCHNHYQGNFWWSKSSFIRKKTSPLEHVDVEWDDYSKKFNLTRRHRAESWIMCDGGRHYNLGNFVSNPYMNDGYYRVKGVSRTNKYKDLHPHDQIVQSQMKYQTGMKSSSIQNSLIT